MRLTTVLFLVVAAIPLNAQELSSSPGNSWSEPIGQAIPYVNGRPNEAAIRVQIENYERKQGLIPLPTQTESITTTRDIRQEFIPRGLFRRPIYRSSVRETSSRVLSNQQVLTLINRPNCPAKTRAALSVSSITGVYGNCQTPASCVIVGYYRGQAMAVACAHQAREERSWTIWPLGHSKPYQARLIYRASGERPDIAVFTFHPSQPVAVASLAESTPPQGTPALVRGYPMGSKLVQNKPGYVKCSYGTNVWVTTPAQQGDSGGAVIDQSNGEVIGILSATDNVECISTNVETLRGILTRHCNWSTSWQPGST